MLKITGLAVLFTGFVVAWGIIIAKQYGVSNIPIILLSSINAIAIVSLALFTYSYMKSTAVMANEMKTAREMEFEIQHSPKVVVDFNIKSSGMIYFVISNNGNGAARNIRFNINPPLLNAQGQKMAEEWPALRDGINYLAPKKSLTFFFDSSFKLSEYVKENLPLSYEVTAEYDWDVSGPPRICDKYSLDLIQYFNTDLSSYKDVSTLIDEVEKIRKILEKTGRRQ